MDIKVRRSPPSSGICYVPPLHTTLSFPSLSSLLPPTTLPAFPLADLLLPNSLPSLHPSSSSSLLPASLIGGREREKERERERERERGREGERERQRERERDRERETETEREGSTGLGCRMKGENMMQREETDR